MKRMKVNMDVDFIGIKRLFNDIDCSYSAAGDYFYIEEKEILEQIKLKQRHLWFHSEYLHDTYILHKGHKYPFSNLLIEKKYKNMLNFKVYYEREWHDRFFKPENFYNVMQCIDINDKRYFREDDGVVFVTIPTNELKGQMIIKDTFVSGLYIPLNEKKLYFREACIEKSCDSAYLTFGFSSFEEALFVRARGLVFQEKNDKL